MTNPNKFSGGAVDLGQLKKSAPAAGAGSSAEVATYFTVTQQNFETEVLRRSMQVPVIVLVGSERAHATATLRTDLEDLAAGQREFVVGYVDADNTPQIAQAFGVQALPTVIALAGGQPLTNFQGAQPKENLRKWLQAITQAVAGKLQGLPDAEEQPAQESQDPRLEAAMEALNASDYDRALNIYDEVLADNDSREIRQARATVVLLKRQDSDQRAEFATADRDLLAGNAEKAFDDLIELMKTTAGDEKEEIKQRLIEYFEMLGNSDPRVKQARTKFASALY